MALTAAERQKRRRDKLKNEGKYEDYKKKNKAEAKTSRDKKRNDLGKLPKSEQNKVKREIKENVRKRVEKCRALKCKVSSISSPYKNNKTLGKAISCVKRSLPTSPRKQKAVIKKLFDNEIGQTDVPSSPCTDTSKCIPLETLNLVKQFYIQDDISRQAPGRKDVITVWNEDGSKDKLQTRHLQHSIKEAYALFVKQYPEIKIGKSKFAELRPKYVLLSSKLPHNVCLCKYHENFMMALESLHNEIPEIPKYSENFPLMLVCNSDSEDCWFNKCVECKEGKIFMDLYREHLQDFGGSTVTWFVWKKCEDRLCKVVEEGLTEDLMKYICGLLPEFLGHCYIKRFQAKVYKRQHEKVTSAMHPSKMAIMQIDFAENYKCISQDEIQSAHWTQAQVSLFTVALYHSGLMHPYVIASDELSHSKETVIPLISRMLEEIPQEIEVLHIWSDGPSSQFKNKFIAASIPMLQEKYKFLVTWNFFATSHGKGPVDGIGGSIKRQVWEAVKKRKQIVYNAKDFVNAAASSSMKVFEMSSSDLQLRSDDLNLTEIFQQSEAIPCMKQQHFLEVMDGVTTSCRLSRELFLTAKPAEQVPKLVATVGEWVLVDYDGQLYPGEVRAIENFEYSVSVMVQAGKHWKWPDNVDEIYYPKEKIRRKLSAPEVVNARGHFSFCELQ